MAACSEVLCKGARFSSDKYFDIVNSAVAHIRNRKINDAVFTAKRNRGFCQFFGSVRRDGSPGRRQEALQSFLLPYYSLLILKIIDKLYYLLQKLIVFCAKLFVTFMEI